MTYLYMSLIQFMIYFFFLFFFIFKDYSTINPTDNNSELKHMIGQLFQNLTKEISQLREDNTREFSQIRKEIT
jgi:hypothetical protein